MDSLNYPRTNNEVNGTHELSQEEWELSASVSNPETTGDCFQRVLLSMNPRHVDALIDLTYGVLIFISIVLIVSVGLELGIAFGFGVLVSYAVHVIWKMARFDPDWMTATVEETVEETVEKQVGPVQDQVKTIEQRVEGRPTEDQVEEMIEETGEGDSQGRSES